MATPPHGAPSNGTSKDTPPAVPASPQLSDRIKITSALASWAGNDRLRKWALVLRSVLRSARHGTVSLCCATERACHDCWLFGGWVLRFVSLLADDGRRVGSGSVSEEKKEKRKRSSTERWLVHELTGRTGSLFSLRRLVGKDKDKEEASPTVPRKVGRGGDASSPNLGRKAATHRHSRSASMTNGTDMADAEPTGASSPQSQACIDTIMIVQNQLTRHCAQPPALLSPPHQHVSGISVFVACFWRLTVDRVWCRARAMIRSRMP